MPSIVKVEVVKRGKVRRARLYYLRDKKEKDLRLQEIKLSAQDLENLKFDETIEEPKKEKEDKQVENKKETKSEDKDTKEEKPKESQKKPENSKKEEPKKEEKPKEKESQKK